MENSFIINRIKNRISEEVAKDVLSEMIADGIVWYNELGFDDEFEAFVRTSQGRSIVANKSALIDLFFDNDDDDDARGDMKSGLTAFLGTMSKSAAQRYFKVTAKDERFNLTSKEVGEVYGIDTEDKSEKEIFNILASFNLFK